MSGLWRRVVALSDPQYTADFQNFFGVREIEKVEQNGTGTVRSDNVNECRKECSESPSVNVDAHFVQNGTLAYQNGSTSVFKTLSEHEHKNGFLKHRGLQNGVASSTRPQNGVQHQEGARITSTNGNLHNGDLPQNDSQDKTEKSSKKAYVIENMFLYYMFSFGACLGNEIFYIFFFSFGLWTFDCGISRKISFIWCVIMYIGQASKDVICWPRPTAPAIPLEGRYELEFGMPSTHAMVGVLIPFGMLYYTYGVYEYNFFLAFVFGVFWCILVSFSRLYLGMHSVLDILAGIVGALIIIGCILPVVDMIDSLLVAHRWSVPGLNIVGIGLCLAYPELKVWSTARGDTTQVMAVFSGIYQGLWYLRSVTTPEMAVAAALTAPTGWATVAAAVGRQLWVILLVLILESLKKLVIYVTATYLGLDPNNPSCKQHLGVELPYKYIGYYVPSFFAGYFMPVLFQYLGWHRKDFLLESLAHSHHFGL